LVAEWLTPKNVASSGDHDILLANRLGFIYTPFIGLWLGWLQKSWKRAAVGAIVGIAIGFVYMALREPQFSRGDGRLTMPARRRGCGHCWL